MKVITMFIAILLATASYSQSYTNTISQFGITWTFDKNYEYGQFANGDYWVVGPVEIVSIDPASSDIGGRIMNGSMINPSPKDGEVQGYDNTMYEYYAPGFDPVFNVARPNGQNLSPANSLIIQSHSSLVSTISNPIGGERQQLQSAAILTVLNAPAPSGSFRPSYSGADKSIKFNVNQINPSLLTSLDPVSSTPSMSTVENYFERPWIDHVPGWSNAYMHPIDNMPFYGRELASTVGEGALMLLLDFPYNQKEKLLIRYLQLGLDIYGIVEDGGEFNWTPDGGVASGRKWPILFAGLMFSDDEMKNIGSGGGTGKALFGEDGQTFYITQEDIDMAHDPDIRDCYHEEYNQSDLGKVEWGIRHATDPGGDNRAWCANYRQCCTGNSWAGFVLAAYIMDAKNIWDHDPLFDYMDRYMTTEEHGTWTRSWSSFSEDMWDKYREVYGYEDIESDLEVFNFISATGDEKNSCLFIQDVDASENTRSNTVKIFNRWGDLVWEIKNYNNTDRAFRGKSNSGNELPSGTYYYKIEFGQGKTNTGFLSLIR